MIRRVTIRHFKRFEEQVFDLADSVVLAGSNNSGKSTLLQAISTWKFGLDRWIAQRTGSKARIRSGVAVTRADFTAVPLREMNLLWRQRLVTQGATGRPRMIEIEVEGDGENEPWSCGLEFQYANPELCYIRPLRAKDMERSSFESFPPDEARRLGVIHVPALSGIAREEPRRERGMQDLLVGEGRPGEILRNLLWEISRSERTWEPLATGIRSLFGIELLRPVYSPAQPHILCEYLESPDKRALDLASAGSGTQQVLLLLAFLYARRASVILLDEPDAHQHVVLQKQVYQEIRKAASERQGQLIVATHSEVILDATEPTRVVGFFGAGPRLLATRQQRDRLRDALRRITTTEMLLARDRGAVLYVENESDEDILREWARIIGHRTLDFFRRAFVHRLKSRNLKEARSHFAALQTDFPSLRGACLVDGDNREQQETERTQSGFCVLRWKRYEIENYLLHPDAVVRYVGGPLARTLTVTQGFEQLIPKNTDLFGDHPALVRMKASDEFLVPLLERASKPTPKRDLYLLARVMESREIHPEVREKLDQLGTLFVSSEDPEDEGSSDPEARPIP